MATHTERLDHIEDRLRDVEESQVRVETKVEVGFEHVNETLVEVKNGLLGNGQPGLKQDVAVLKQESEHCMEHRKDESSHLSLTSLAKFHRLVYAGSAAGGAGGFITLGYFILDKLGLI